MLRFFPHFTDYTTTKARFELVVESLVGRVCASLATIKVSPFVIISITFQSALPAVSTEAQFKCSYQNIKHNGIEV